MSGTRPRASYETCKIIGQPQMHTEGFAVATAESRWLRDCQLVQVRQGKSCNQSKLKVPKIGRAQAR
eukprot:6185088-Pleurochrysis_carterae.AAC.1